MEGKTGNEGKDCMSRTIPVVVEVEMERSP
jgi:hypothetical protein